MKKKILLFFAITLIMLSALVGCMSSGSRDTYDICYYVGDETRYQTEYEGVAFTHLRNIPERFGYKFLGLYDQRTGGSRIVEPNGQVNVSITSAVTLYSQWEALYYNLYFEANGGFLSESQKKTNLAYGTEITSLPVPEREGYDFVGWKNIDGIIISDGATPYQGSKFFKHDYYRMNHYTDTYDPQGEDASVLVAQWEVKKYEITFEYNDSAYQNTTVYLQHDEQFSEDLYPEKIDTGTRELVGWTASYGSGILFDGNVTSDITLFAIWKDYKKVTVYEDVNGEPKEMRVYKNEPFYTPERGGYTFTGWYANTTMGGLPLGIISYTNVPEVMYASWALATYNISFVTDTGYIAPKRYTIEDTLTLPIIEKENYTFVGWCDNPELTGTARIVIRPGTYGDLTLYPLFKGEDRVVNLDAKEGIIGLTSQKVEYGAIAKLGVPALDGYAFVGWFDEDGNQITDRYGTSYEKWFYDDAVTLSAKYDEKYFIYITNSITGKTEQFGDYYLFGESVIVMGEAVTGYDFDGFYSAEGRLEAITLEFLMTVPENDVHLTAKYTPKQYVVLLDADGGICKKTELVVSYGDSVVFPTVYKEGYIFHGWRLSNIVYEGDATLTDASGALKNQSGKWDYDSNAVLIPYFTEDTSGSISISDGAGFAAISQNPGGSYKLVCDVDMSGVSYNPFEFSGTLEGNGFTVKNLSLASQGGNFGIFTRVSGTVSNITFENVSVTTTSYGGACVGGVCGDLTGTLNRIVFKGSVSGQGGDSADIGGLVGKMHSGAITYCENYASVIGNALEGTGTTGGIVGVVNGGSITGCVNYGAVSGTYRTGGIVGISNGVIPKGNLTNYGTVSGMSYVGGIFGRISGGGSYTVNLPVVNTGRISGKDHVGGIFGRWENTTNSNSNHLVVMIGFSNTAEIIGETYVGGIGGSMYFMNSWYGIDTQINDFKNTGNVTGTTRVGGLFGYLQSENSSYVKSSSSSAIITAESYIGGLVGEMHGVIFDGCKNVGSTIIATGYVISGSNYDAYIGGYAGYGFGAKNCENNVKISYEKQGRFVGGILGRAGTALVNCTNSADIYAPKASYVGGICGFDDSDGGVTHNTLTNNGNITGVDRVGGIMGEMSNSTDSNSDYSPNLIKFVNRGNVTGSTYVGGTIGYYYAINSWYTTHINAEGFANTGDVTADHYVGGLIGYVVAEGSSTISNSTSSATVTANYCVGGLIGYAENLTVEACSNAGSSIVANGYQIDGANYYAYVGGYVGRGTSVYDCINRSEIVYTGRGSYVGGIIGLSYGHLKGCENHADVTAAKASCVGGIAGYCGAGGSLNFTKLSNTGNVTGNEYVGGNIGRIYNYTDSNANYTVSIIELSNTGDVIGANYVAGNIAHIYANNNWYSTSVIINLIENEGDVTGKSYVGGCVGYATTDNGGSNITSASSSATVTAEYYVGGIAGYLATISLSESTVDGSNIVVTGALIENGVYYTYAGGLVGYGWTVTECNNENVNITITGKGSRIGGILGFSNGDVKNCTNKSTINAPSSNEVGGIVGYHGGVGAMTFQNLENKGKVVGADYTGGIFGIVRNHVEYNHNYTVTLTDIKNCGEVVGVKYVGGIAGYVYLNNTWYNAILRGTVLENEGNVTGEANVGGIMAYCSSDDGSSTLVGCTSTGEVAGEPSSEIVCEIYNVKIEA